VNYMPNAHFKDYIKVEIVLVEEQQVDWRNWLFWKVEGWWWLGDSP
jgi:hypothetical protein